MGVKSSTWPRASDRQAASKMCRNQPSSPADTPHCPTRQSSNWLRRHSSGPRTSTRTGWWCRWCTSVPRHSWTRGIPRHEWWWSLPGRCQSRRCGWRGGPTLRIPARSPLRRPTTSWCQVTRWGTRFPSHRRFWLLVCTASRTPPSCWPNGVLGPPDTLFHRSTCLETSRAWNDAALNKWLVHRTSTIRTHTCSALLLRLWISRMRHWLRISFSKVWIDLHWPSLTNLLCNYGSYCRYTSISRNVYHSSSFLQISNLSQLILNLYYYCYLNYFFVYLYFCWCFYFYN